MSLYYENKDTVDTDFTVVKHSLRGFEGDVNGVTYRGGYAVVKKGSKEYKNLLKIRPKAITNEYPLTHLQKLNFIINEKQIEYVWGKAIYNSYMKMKNYTPQVEAMHKAREEAPKCTHMKGDGNQCGNPKRSDSDFCNAHVIFDPRIKEIVEALPPMPKKQKKAKIRSLINKYIK